ncbi:hypothetical protein QVD17_01477 [Tagetes erecta]|uniref:Uncharacterized protein n=1 Tax=Tagetes erecta TaxID=13708 RepID=A0AAD8LAP1_TARER|nr:hypothetical protein QVD17_01477 [Tagetes erecta]
MLILCSTHDLFVSMSIVGDMLRLRPGWDQCLLCELTLLAMSNPDEYAVSRILESLKRDRTLSVNSEEHEIKELNVDEVMKLPSNMNQQPSKSSKPRSKLPKKSQSRQSLKVQSKLPTKSQSSKSSKAQSKLKSKSCKSSKVQSKLPTRSQSSKSLKVQSKLPTRSQSIKSLKVRSKLPTKSQSSKSSEVQSKKRTKSQSDIDIGDQPKVKRQKRSATVKIIKETCSSSNVQKYKSLRLRNAPKPFYNVLKCLSILQKKKVIDMGFGSLLEFSCAGIPSKLGHFVVDKFHAQSMKMKLENGDIQITPQLIQHIFRLPCGGTPVESLVAKDENKECYVNWRLQFVKEMRPSDIVRRIEETEDNGIVFVLNFIILFLNSMVDCKTSGKCKIDVLELFDEDVDFKTVDWCGYIYECLKRCKDGWKRDDIGSYFTGPVTVLMLIYLQCTSFKKLDTPVNVPAIKFWSVEMMKKREILEIESGGFGCCEIKKLPEKRNAQEESKLEIDTLIEDIESKFASFLDAKMDLELLFASALRKFPDCQDLVEKKDLFDSIFINSGFKDNTAAAGPNKSERLVDDLELFADHANRKTVNMNNVIRSGTNILVDALWLLSYDLKAKEPRF